MCWSCTDPVSLRAIQRHAPIVRARSCCTDPVSLRAIQQRGGGPSDNGVVRILFLSGRSSFDDAGYDLDGVYGSCFSQGDPAAPTVSLHDDLLYGSRLSQGDPACSIESEPTSM